MSIAFALCMKRSASLLFSCPSVEITLASGRRMFSRTDSSRPRPTHAATFT